MYNLEMKGPKSAVLICLKLGQCTAGRAFVPQSLEQINFKTLAPALNGESESRLRLRSGQCFALSEHFNLFKVKMLYSHA